MTVTTEAEAFEEIGAAIQGIQTASALIPESLETAHLPYLYPIMGPSSDDESSLGNSMTLERRTWRIQVAVLPYGQGERTQAEEEARTLIPLVKDAYRKRKSLEGVTGVQHVRVAGDTGVIPLREFSNKYIGFEVLVEVTSYVEKSFVDY